MYRPIARLMALAVTSSLLAACSGGGGGGGGSVTPSGGGGGTSASPYACPTSDTVEAQSRRTAQSEETAKHFESRGKLPATGTDSGTIAVTYDRSGLLASLTTVASRERAAGATFTREFDFPYVSKVTRILTVAPAQESAVISQLQGEPSVLSVNDAGARRYALTVSSPYFSNDPYFNGFSTTVADPEEDGNGATPPPATYHVAPYEERADVPGQWDMHVVGLGYAFEYSQSGNGSSVENAGALGSSSVKIAMIDTGQDTTHPELTSKIVYQKCFVTNLDGVQSSSSYTTDEDGHGTDTAGIAADDMNNALGFVGDGGNVVIYGYRVFPTPDDNCNDPTTNDPQCSATLQDIASAINDAVAQHVNVISMSLGGSCPDDPPESTAVANAIAADVIVVAASGNEGGEGIDAPACDSGVIAAGATSLDDGKPNGTNSSGGNAGGTASDPVEYVAAYSQYGSPAKDLQSASAWGIVAPGGDPVSDSDDDDLHWIENIWTSTPYDASFAGTCTGDYPTDDGTTDCRTEIAGTSMATPHVAGAAALILSVNSGYQSASAMKQLLCTTADEINDPHEGCGRLNVYRAMAKALGDPTLP